MIRATILKVEFEPGLGLLGLEQGIKKGSLPKGKILGGSNGTFVTTDSYSLSKLTAVVQLENREIIKIPIKHAIRKATGWQNITDKRVGLITQTFPISITVYKDESNGFWYISDKDMQSWANMIRY